MAMRVARVRRPKIRLYCKHCNYIQFSSYCDFTQHHLRHIRLPDVSLSRLSPTLVERVRRDRANSEDDRRTEQSDQVPPIKLTVVKQNGTTNFLVIKREGTPSSSNGRGTPKEDFRNWVIVPKVEMEEEDETLKRLASRISITRKKGTLTTQNETKSKPTSPKTTGNDDSSKRDPDEEFLQKLRALDALSISACPRNFTDYAPTDSGNEPKPSTSGVVVSSNRKSIDLNDLKKMNEQNSDKDKKVFDDNSKLLEKLLSGRDVSVEPKPQSPRVPKLVIREPYVKLERIDEGPHGSGITPTKRPRTESSDGRSSLSSSGSSPAKKVAEEPPANTKDTNENPPSVGRPRRNSRTTYSTRGRRKQYSWREVKMPDAVSPREASPRQGEVETPARVTRHRNSAAGSETSADQVENREDTVTNTADLPQMPSTSSDASQQQDLSACVQNGTQSANNSAKSGKHTARSTTTQKITTRNQDGSSRTVTVRTTERYAETTNTVPEALEVQEIFSNLQTSDNRNGQGLQQSNEQNLGAAHWVSPRASPNQKASQGPVLGDANNPINVDDTNTLTIVQGFLSGFMQAQRQQSLSERNTAENTTPVNQQVLSLPNTPAQINMTFHVQPPPPLRAAGVPLSQPLVGPPPLSQGYTLAPNQGLQQQKTSPQVIPKPPALQQCPQMQAKAYQISAQPQPQPQIQAQPTQQQARPAKRSIPGPPPAPEFFMPKQRRSEPATTVKAPEAKESPKPSTSGTKASASPQPSISGPKPSASPKPSTSGPKPSASPKPSTSGPKPSASPQPSTSGPKPSASPQPSTSGTKASGKRGINPEVVASVLAARGITVTPSTRHHSKTKNKSKAKKSTSSPVLNISPEITITRNRGRKQSGKKRVNIIDTATTSIPTIIPNTITAAVTSAVATDQRRNCTPIINHNIGRPDRCATVDLTNDNEENDVDAAGPSVNRFLCNQCGNMFPTAASLEQHRSTHVTPRPTVFSCETCDVQFSTAEDLERHRLDTHRYRARKPNWVIPVVDFDIPGAEQRLVEHGINHFIPISMDGGSVGGNYAIPLITHSTRRRQRDLLGLSNVIVVGQMRTCFAPRDE